MPTTDDRKITLTFDNGPHPDVTPRVLDILAHRAIRTTFFLVGESLARVRAPAERAAAEGHWIGNHSWSHSVPFRDRGDPDYVASEIDRTQALIGALAHPRKFFRPFGGGGRLDGALNGQACAHLAAGGYTCILWNCVPGDFSNRDGWPAIAHRQIAEHDWPLVVLHDVNPDAMRHLEGFLDDVLAKGYRFEQEFPPDCIAMQSGVPTQVMDSGVLAN